MIYLIYLIVYYLSLGISCPGPTYKKKAQPQNRFDNTKSHPNSTKHLLFKCDFESNDPVKEWNHIESAGVNSITKTIDPAFTGNHVARFILNRSDRKVAGSTRAELVLAPENQLKIERWYGLRIFLPTTYINRKDSEILVQWHEYPDFHLGESWRSPPISMRTLNGRWQLVINWASDKVNTDISISGNKNIDLGIYTTNSWTNWVFHIKFSYQDDGLIEIWKNNEMVYSLKGPNSYNDETGNYFKVGIYKWDWSKHSTEASHRIIFVDDVRIGDERSSYSEVHSKNKH